jgi:hypothetical protein
MGGTVYRVGLLLLWESTLPYTKDSSIWWNRRNSVTFTDDPGNTIIQLGGDVKKLLRTRTGDSLKGWRDRIRLQQNATTNLSGDYVDMKGNDRVSWDLHHVNLFDFPTSNDFRVRTIRGYVHTPLITIDPAVIGTTEAANRAAIAFLKKARSVQSEFSSPTFLGEFKQTLGMLRRPGEGLRNILGSYMNKVKDLKHRQPKNWKKNLSSTWLESVFGWLPLASDLKEGYNAYSNLVKERDNDQVIISSMGIETDRVSEAHSNINMNGFHVIHHTQVIDKAFVRYRGAIIRRVDATLRDKLGRVGFNPTEFVPTAWELLPWSFLVDYFSNIGDVLTASAFVRADLAWSSGVTITNREYHCSSHIDVNQTAINIGAWFKSVSGSPCVFSVSRRHMNRVSSVAIPPPHLSLEIPGSPAQWANMTALFAQANAIHPQRGFRPR